MALDVYTPQTFHVVSFDHLDHWQNLNGVGHGGGGNVDDRNRVDQNGGFGRSRRQWHRWDFSTPAIWWVGDGGWQWSDFLRLSRRPVGGAVGREVAIGESMHGGHYPSIADLVGRGSKEAGKGRGGGGGDDVFVVF